MTMFPSSILAGFNQGQGIANILVFNHIFCRRQWLRAVNCELVSMPQELSPTALDIYQFAIDVKDKDCSSFGYLSVLEDVNNKEELSEYLLPTNLQYLCQGIVSSFLCLSLLK